MDFEMLTDRTPAPAPGMRRIHVQHVGLREGDPCGLLEPLHGYVDVPERATVAATTVAAGRPTIPGDTLEAKVAALAAQERARAASAPASRPGADPWSPAGAEAIYARRRDAVAAGRMRA